MLVLMFHPVGKNSHIVWSSVGAELLRKHAWKYAMFLQELGTEGQLELWYLSENRSAQCQNIWSCTHPVPQADGDADTYSFQY